MGFTTRQIHSGVEPDPLSGAIVTPIYQTTTYVQDLSLIHISEPTRQLMSSRMPSSA